MTDARRQPSGANSDRLDAAMWARLGWPKVDTRRSLASSDQRGIALRQRPPLDVTVTEEHPGCPLTAVLKRDYPGVWPRCEDLTLPTARAGLAQWANPRDRRALDVPELTRRWHPQRYPNGKAAQMHAY